MPATAVTMQKWLEPKMATDCEALPCVRPHALAEATSSKNPTSARTPGWAALEKRSPPRTNEYRRKRTGMRRRMAAAGKASVAGWRSRPPRADGHPQPARLMSPKPHSQKGTADQRQREHHGGACRGAAAGGSPERGEEMEDLPPHEEADDGRLDALRAAWGSALSRAIKRSIEVSPGSGPKSRAKVPNVRRCDATEPAQRGRWRNIEVQK